MPSIRRLRSRVRSRVSCGRRLVACTLARRPSRLLLAPPEEGSRDGAAVMGPGDEDHLPDHQVPGRDKGHAPHPGLGSGGF